MLHFISHIYIVLVLTFYIDVQSDEMTSLKCLAARFLAIPHSMSYHNYVPDCVIFHIIEQLCGHTMLPSYLVVAGKRSLLLF